MNDKYSFEKPHINTLLMKLVEEYKEKYDAKGLIVSTDGVRFSLKEDGTEAEFESEQALVQYLTQKNREA